MNIIRCDDSHRGEWGAFVGESSRALFYHRWGWRIINARTFGHRSVYLAAWQSGRIVGILPMVHLKSILFGNLACSMPFVNYGGPCAISDEIEQRLLEEATAVADEWRVDYLEIRSPRHLGERYPCSDHKVSMTIALEADPELVLRRMKREHRAEIRRAYKNGFVARFGTELIDDFYEVLSESWHELGTPMFGVDYLRAIRAEFPDSIRVCVLYDTGGRPAAGAFDGLHGSVVEGMWLGVRPQYRRLLAGYVLYWELIKHACELGYESFHLGRSSKDSNAEQFKRKWNAEAMQLYWHYVLRRREEVPSLNPDNPKFRLAIRAWRALPLRVTQKVGPLLARSIP